MAGIADSFGAHSFLNSIPSIPQTLLACGVLRGILCLYSLHQFLLNDSLYLIAIHKSQNTCHNLQQEDENHKEEILHNKEMATDHSEKTEI